ncbi:MAG: formylglycine-generating enzyme family protein, partial [Kiritimatiellae bacterium]|nr:formylglycine-generating enzyme family protein [Kiritimatiellia bacterium]
ENVSWDDCQKFIGKVSAAARRQLGGEARLPTEAEWEYACRAGTAGPYGGTGRIDDMGWYAVNSGKGTHPVGGKCPNAWGFHDMHGNVWEWCQDTYDEQYYSRSPTMDPCNGASGDDRVLRGGGWYFDARFCRSAHRDRDFPAFRGRYIGFRLCCSLSPRE